MKNEIKEESLEPREIAIEYCKAIRKDIKTAKEIPHPLSKQIEEELRKVCKIPSEESLDKYPELKAEVDYQKNLEVRAIKIWEKEIQKVMKENSLTKEDIKEE
jgi:hypothetical protein